MREDIRVDLTEGLKKPQMHPCEFEPWTQSLLHVLKKDIPGVFVEIGVNKGKSTAAIYQLLNREGQRRKVYSIDPTGMALKFWPLRRDRFAGDLQVQHIALPSQDPEAKRAVHEPIAWLFIDGCHCFDCVLEDIDIWCPKVSLGGLAVFHDYDQGPCYRKRDHCHRAGQERRWGVAPAVWMARGLGDFERWQIVAGGKSKGTGLGIYERRRISP